MLEKKTDKTKHDTKQRDDGVELENQFILRLPEEPAKALHEALQTSSLKDRLTIKMDADLRYGEVQFDNWLLHAKIMDLPTIIESLKTIDNKSFYKTADICQIMICKEEPDSLPAEEESPNKTKKKDSNKVDKKYLWSHGITPPCKNIRKRRFRKTLKKKNVEAPEIEKEVKRLLREDNEAVNVKFEIIEEEEDKSGDMSNTKDDNEDNDNTLNDTKQTNDSSKKDDMNGESDVEDQMITTSEPNIIGGVGEHDIFGEEVSSSEDEDDRERIRRNVEENSHLSDDDSHVSQFSRHANGTNNAKSVVTEFNKSMFTPSKGREENDSNKFHSSNTNLEEPSANYYEEQKRTDYDEDYSNETPITREEANTKITELRRQCDELKLQQALKAQEISSIQNPTLKQRMQETLDNLLSQIVEKELEIEDYQNVIRGE